jgi:hypothetical protein
MLANLLQPITPFDLTNFTEEDARLGVSMQAIVDRYLTGTISLDSSVYSLFDNVPVEQIVIWCSCLGWMLILSALGVYILSQIGKLQTLMAVLACQLANIKSVTEAQMVLAGSGKPSTVSPEISSLYTVLWRLYNEHGSNLYLFLQLAAMLSLAGGLMMMARSLGSLAGTFPVHRKCCSKACLVVR